MTWLPTEVSKHEKKKKLDMTRSELWFLGALVGHDPLVVCFEMIKRAITTWTDLFRINQHHLRRNFGWITTSPQTRLRWRPCIRWWATGPGRSTWLLSPSSWGRQSNKRVNSGFGLRSKAIRSHWPRADVGYRQRAWRRGRRAGFPRCFGALVDSNWTRGDRSWTCRRTWWDKKSEKEHIQMKQSVAKVSILTLYFFLWLPTCTACQILSKRVKTKIRRT